MRYDVEVIKTDQGTHALVVNGDYKGFFGRDTLAKANARGYITGLPHKARLAWERTATGWKTWVNTAAVGR